MIQIKRGKTNSWRKNKIKLADGQPGYDKDKHKIKIGDGKKTWSELPYASGISATEVFDSEKNAKAKYKLDKEDTTIITYGTGSPDKNTVGQVYLQYYDTEPEVDYVVATGISNGWSYQKWQSGIATCSRVFDVNTSIQTAIDDRGLYQNSSSISKIDYPFVFQTAPNEVASVQSQGSLVWLAAAKGFNTNRHSAAYNILSADKITTTATYRISIQVEGFWK
jgi:hypothetical protein